MSRRGKYKLFSYFIENELIIYRSLNRKKEIISFSIVYSNDLPHLFQILTNSIRNGLIESFSLQLDLGVKNGAYYIIKFKAKNLLEIKRIFNILKDNFDKNQIVYDFLVNSSLEYQFQNIFHQSINHNTQISKEKSSILIYKEQEKIQIEYYKINLDNLKKRFDEIYTFFNLSKATFKTPLLVVYFRASKKFSRIRINAFLINYLKKHQKYPTQKYKDEFNLLSQEILQKKNLKIRDLLKFLWREPIKKFQDYYLSSFLKIFKSAKIEKNDSHYFLETIENKLSKEGIPFKKLNNKLLIINETHLFFIFKELDYKLILKILKKYHPNYNILLFFVNINDYKKLLELRRIDEMEKVKIFSIKKLKELDFSCFLSSNQNIPKSTAISGAE